MCMHNKKHKAEKHDSCINSELNSQTDVFRATPQMSEAIAHCWRDAQAGL